jgi:pilus assembly protein Flp/PilA
MLKLYTKAKALLATKDDGVTAAEYGLILVLVVVAVAVAVTALGGAISGAFDSATNELGVDGGGDE